MSLDIGKAEGQSDDEIEREWEEYKRRFSLKSCGPGDSVRRGVLHELPPDGPDRRTIGRMARGGGARRVTGGAAVRWNVRSEQVWRRGCLSVTYPLA